MNLIETTMAFLTNYGDILITLGLVIFITYFAWKAIQAKKEAKE